MAVISKRKLNKKLDKTEGTFLSNSHLLALEVESRDIATSKATLAAEQIHLSNLILQMENMGYKIEKQRAKVAEAEVLYTQTQKKFAETKKTVWSEYGISTEGSLGYDPKTGEIK